MPGQRPSWPPSPTTPRQAGSRVQEDLRRLQAGSDAWRGPRGGVLGVRARGLLEQSEGRGWHGRSVWPARLARRAMPTFNWPADPGPEIQAFAQRHSNAEAGLLLIWATSCIDALHYLDEIDLAFDPTRKVSGSHRPTSWTSPTPDGRLALASLRSISAWLRLGEHF